MITRGSKSRLWLRAGRTHFGVILGIYIFGCNLIPQPIPIDPPADLQVVVGGMTDQRPYFGTARSIGADDATFLLATCGCGDWRILIQNPDGTQVQLPVHFYTSGDYVPTGPITVFGRDSNTAAIGTVDQDGGNVSGSIELTSFARNFSAIRGDAHSQSIQACAMCHVGDNPIFPRPANHVPGVTDCFNCHTVNIQ